MGLFNKIKYFSITTKNQGKDMKFKIKKVTEDQISASVEHEGYVIVSDFPRVIDEHGGVNSQNVRLLNEDAPSVQILAEMMQGLRNWLVKEHSDKFKKIDVSKVKAKEFIEKLANTIKEQGLSQYRLEQLSGLSRGLIKRYFDGDSSPSLENLIKIANSLGYELDLKKIKK